MAFDDCPGGLATHFCIVPYDKKRTKYLQPTKSEPLSRMVLLWGSSPGEELAFGDNKRYPIEKLSYQMDAKTSADFVWGWLKGKDCDFGREPDMDGSVAFGFRIYTDYWGHVDGNHYGICGVKAEYALIGK